MTNTIIVGDALTALAEVESESVQTHVTSPPYYGLRDYGVAGRIGLEETPEAYIEKLVAVFREGSPDACAQRNALGKYRRQLRGADVHGRGNRRDSEIE
jgi:DNA modification methylase